MYSKILCSKYKATIVYIMTIVLVNVLFSYLPYIHLFGDMVSPADAIVGSIYIARDFAQRETGHRVIIAMVIGALLSYLLAAQVVATASVVAFSVGETIDWAIFTWTRKPLSDRLLISSAFSAPVDTLVFLALLGNLNLTEFTAMSLAKIGGVLLVWWLWQRQRKRTNTADLALSS